MPKPGTDDYNLLLTLDRGLRVLEEVASSGGYATAKGLAHTVDVNLSTMYQLLRTLQNSGYVQRMRGGRFQLGARVGYLIDHYNVQTSPPQSLVDRLHELHAATEETVYISLVQGFDIIAVSSIECTKSLRVGSVTIGYSGHPHARASGKAVLAYSDPEHLDSFIVDRNLERLTDRTITVWDDLIDELAAVRESGVAFDMEEYEKGIVCVAAAILDKVDSPVGAYAVSMPVARFEDDREAVTARVLEAAEAGSRSLGYSGTFPPAERTDSE